MRDAPLAPAGPLRHIRVAMSKMIAITVNGIHLTHSGTSCAACIKCSLNAKLPFQKAAPSSG